MCIRDSQTRPETLLAAVNTFFTDMVILPPAVLTQEERPFQPPLLASAHRPVSYTHLDEDGNIKGSADVLIRTVPVIKASLLYCCRGFVADEDEDVYKRQTCRWVCIPKSCSRSMMFTLLP